MLAVLVGLQQSSSDRLCMLQTADCNLQSSILVANRDVILLPVAPGDQGLTTHLAGTLSPGRPRRPQDTIKNTCVFTTLAPRSLQEAYQRLPDTSQSFLEAPRASQKPPEASQKPPRGPPGGLLELPAGIQWPQEGVLESSELEK